MPFANTTKNAMLDALDIATASLHTGDPGQDGANEVAGGDPAYARKAIAFGAAADGARAATTAPVFDVPGGGTTVTHIGYWSSGNVFQGSAEVTQELFGAQGTYTLAEATLEIGD